MAPVAGAAGGSRLRTLCPCAAVLFRKDISRFGLSFDSPAALSAVCSAITRSLERRAWRPSGVCA